MSAVQPPSPPAWPKVLKCGEFIVLVWSHVIHGYVGQIPCWTYLSRGMGEVNQPELVITLQRRLSEEEEDVSMEPLSWFKMVYAWGKKGRKIDPYHTHEAHSEHWLGSKKLETITYGMPIELSGFGAGVLPPRRLHGIALTSDEAQIAKAFGYTRVLGHYGLSNRWFPYCPWIDRDRGDCFTWAETEGSIRAKLLPMTHKIRGVSARLDGDRIIVEIAVGRGEEIRAKIQAIPPEEVFLLESFLHPNAVDCYIWKKGNTAMMRYGGCDVGKGCTGMAFFVFCPEQRKNHYSVIEDGMIVYLTDRSWLAIREALIKQCDISIPLDADNGYEPATVSIEFLTQKYSYPPAGLELSLTGGYFKPWYSKKPGWLQKSPLRLDRLALGERSGPDATGFPAVVDFMERIGEGVAAVVPKKSRGSQTKLIVVKFELPADDAESCYELNFSPDIDGIDGNKIWDVLRGLERPQVWEYTTVGMYFGVWE